MSENKIKKVIIREDLLSITKDYRKAILLNQFIYWSERVSDADKFIEKENEIAKNNGEVERELFYGWIYKTAEELADEVMLGLSASQIRRYINDLVDLGYISKRNNPKYKWDRTLQYRVNLVNIAKDLKKNGFPLSDYKIDIPDNENTNTHGCAINNEPEENQSQSSERAIPENHPEIIARDYIHNSLSPERAGESESPQTKRQSRKKEANENFERIWKLYPKKLGKGQVSDTQKLKLLDVGFDELSRAIQRCCVYNKDKDRQYWQNGSTFFNSGYIDFLDENYEDSSSSNVASPGEVQKEPLSEKEKIRLGIEKAREIFGDDYGESYWSGMDDSNIIITLEYLGIRVDEL